MRVAFRIDKGMNGKIGGVQFALQADGTGVTAILDSSSVDNNQIKCLMDSFRAEAWEIQGEGDHAQGKTCWKSSQEFLEALGRAPKGKPANRDADGGMRPSPMVAPGQRRGNALPEIQPATLPQAGAAVPPPDEHPGDEPPFEGDRVGDSDTEATDAEGDNANKGKRK